MSFGVFLPQAASQIVRMQRGSGLIQNPQQSQRSAYEILVSVPQESEFQHEPDSPRLIPEQQDPIYDRMGEHERRMVKEIV